MRKLIGELSLIFKMLMSCCFVVRSRHVMAFPIQRLSMIQRQRRRASYYTSTTIHATISDLPTEVVLPNHVNKWLDVQLPEGRCVGVYVAELPGNKGAFATPESLAATPDHWMHAAYHPRELAFGMELSDSVASSFWLGRLAMRIALEFPDYPILKDSYGRPQLGGKVCGSISHKGTSGIALVSNTTLVAGVGVDLEFTSRPGKRSIAPRVLTEREQEVLGSIPGVSVEEEILLRFSLKEAIYKAAHPLLCQYVGFQEAEVTPHADGTASCTWYLETEADKAIGNLKAHWTRLDEHGFFLTSASVQESS